MGKKAYILVGIVLLLLLAGGGYFFYQRSNKTTNSISNENTQGQASTETQNQPTEGTLNNLLESNTPQACSYSSSSTSGTVDGTVYVADGKMRADYTSTNGSDTLTGHMIIDSGYSYVWMEGSKQGYKTAINQQAPETSPSPTAQENNQESSNLDQKVSYTCSAWTVDESKFTFPSDVNFNTIAVPSPETNTNTNSTDNQAACAYCDNLPSDQQAACKTSLNCQ